MSILSDRQIKNLSAPPTLVQNWGPGLFGSYPLTMAEPYSESERAELAQYEALSTNLAPGGKQQYEAFDPVKHLDIAPRMITPFVDHQVKIAPFNENTVIDLIEMERKIEELTKSLEEHKRNRNPNPSEFDLLEAVIERSEMELAALNVQYQTAKVVGGRRIVSYGLSSYGYDVRIAPEFKIFTNVNSTVIDPLDFDEASFVDFKGDVCIIPPNSFVLARSIEYFRMPKNVTGIVLAKSTYARTGMSCLATPLEAEWEGHITLEYANSTPLPMKLYANQGAAQVLFFEGEPCMTTYADRGGKYQGQTGITLPRG